jgi:hypothetical protein
VDVERLLPADALKPRWSSASALVYLGGFTLLGATSALLAILGEDHGEWAAVGYGALAAALAAGLALWLQGSGRAVAAGVLATLAVVFFAVFVGSVESAIGILDAQVGDYQAGSLVVELATIAASLVGLRRFRAPLLMLPLTVTAWFALIDLGSLSSDDVVGELLLILVGIALIAVAIAVDRAGREPYGLWLHLVGGLSLGGGALSLVDGDFGWVLVGLLSLGYVAAAYLLARSSYAVLGVIGILTTTTYFTFDAIGLVGAFLPFGEGPVEGDARDPWQVALWFAVVGLGIVALGLVEDRVTALRRR